jgi:DNA-binding response OmpR family regulator
MVRILMIDDDEGLCYLLTEYLKDEGFHVECAHDGEAGMEMALAHPYSLILLDVMLPGGKDGFWVLDQIRAKTDTPTLMLTARGDDADRILGLDKGADDYLPKPFNPRELLARIHAVLRRSGEKRRETSDSRGGRSQKVGDILLDPSRRVVFQSERSVELTSVEFNLLEVLLRNAGTVVRRADLAKTVLGRDLSSSDRSVDVHVSRIRSKLGPGRDGAERIKSIRKSGYIFVLPATPGGSAVDRESPSAEEGEEDAAE